MKRRHTWPKLLLRRQHHTVDNLIVILMLMLVVFGILMVADASSIRAESHFGDKLFFAKQQSLAALVGLGGFLGASFVPITWWRKCALPFFIGSLGLLLLVLIPGIGVQVLGARRWITMAAITFQPGEVIKLSMVLYLARFFDRKTVNILPFLLLTALVGGLIMVEPDLGTAAIVTTTAFSIFFMSGAPLGWFAVVLPVLAILAGLTVWFSPYRRERLLAFLSINDNPISSSYHVSQVLLALSSGGWLGVGLGQARSKYLFLPEVANDSIFAVIGEELGFIGVVILLAVFVVLVIRIYQVALGTGDVFAKLTAGGIATWVGAQTFVNVAAMTATVPLTGVPLPFISYGGTALVVLMTALGIVYGISRQKEQMVST